MQNLAKPKISVIIPVYNSAATINQCLKSVFNQTFKNFEVIVVNDGSTDNFLSVIRRWESRIKLFNQKNQGAPKARNFGFNQSRGGEVIFCDADVVMKPGMLQIMDETLIKNRLAAYVYSSFKFGWKEFKLWPFDAQKLKKMPSIHTTSLIKREYFPGFDENLKRFQDWDLYLTMLANGHQGVWIDEVLFSVKSGGTMSSWLPKIFYHLPFLKSVKKYKEAEEIIKKKHNLEIRH